LVHLNRKNKVESLCSLPGKKKRRRRRRKNKHRRILGNDITPCVVFSRSMNNGQECLLVIEWSHSMKRQHKKYIEKG
jgi:hypothetical protein